MVISRVQIGKGVMPAVEYLGDQKPVNKSAPLVSVCIPTYQHAKYIQQCLDSVLAQEADFQIEILIGEDQSTDGTREICIAYADKFPDRIRLFLNDRNDLILIDGRPSGRANFLNLFAMARGEFVALCEGDDYWTDPAKLARQIAVLVKRPECSLVFHNAAVMADHVYAEDFSKGLSEGCYNIESVILKPWFVPTQSMLFRKDWLELGEWAKHVYNCDYAIQLALAAQGPFYYIDRSMSAYRVHGGGTSRGRQIFYHPFKVVETLSIFNCLSGFRFDSLIKSRVDDIRSGMLAIERQDIVDETIRSMGWLEKLLTFRCYARAVQRFWERIKN